jgi:hypothetical protein
MEALMIRPVLSLALLALLAAAKAPPQTATPAEAITLADAATPRIGASGRFAMTVVETGQVGGAVFLNSSADYRAPGDLSLRLSPNVVKALTRQYGAAPAAYFKGRQVVVDGTVRRERIVDTINSHAVGFDRWQHVVRILFPHQIVSVS